MNTLSTRKHLQIKDLITKGYSVRQICKIAKVSRNSVLVRRKALVPKQSFSSYKLFLRRRKVWYEKELFKINKALEGLS